MEFFYEVFINILFSISYSKLWFCWSQFWWYSMGANIHSSSFINDVVRISFILYWVCSVTECSLCVDEPSRYSMLSICFMGCDMLFFSIFWTKLLDWWYLKYILTNLKYEDINGTIPESTFISFQMTFAIITPALIIGAFVEKMKFLTVIIFLSLWIIIVYATVTHWV